jgi:hypothetical protein
MDLDDSTHMDKALAIISTYSESARLIINWYAD